MNLSLHLEIQENHAELFRRTIEYLLANTFIIAQREKSLFNFVKNTSNQTNINNYLNLMDCNLYVDEKLGVAMLQPNERDEEGACFITKKFTVSQSAVLLVLAKIYMDQFEKGTEVISTTIGELMDHLHAYKISGPPNEKNWVINSLLLFRRLSLVDFNTGKDKRLAEDTDIIIYDSIRLQICSSGQYELFQANLRDYGYAFGTSDEEEGTEDADEIIMDKEEE